MPSYFRVPFRVEISNNSTKFTLHKKPFFNDSKEHRKLPKLTKKTTSITNPQGVWVLVQSNSIDYKVFVPNEQSLMQAIEERYPAIIKGWRQEELTKACLDYKTSEDNEETIYDIFQDNEEEQTVNTYADDEPTDEDYEAAWNNYERMCYEWD